MLKAEKPKPDQEVPRTLGEHLRKRRLELGIPQQEVAVKIGVSAYTILNWEHDHKEPAVTLWPAIIDFLGSDPNPEPVKLAAVVRVVRRRRGLRQRDLAELVGVTSGTIARWERGEGEPQEYRRWRLLELLAVE